MKIRTLPQSLKEHASAAISRKLWEVEGSRRCTGLRSWIRTWFPRLLGGCCQYENTHGPTKRTCDYYRVVERANWPDHSVAFDITQVKLLSSGLTVLSKIHKVIDYTRCYKRTSSACGVIKEHHHCSARLSSIESITQLAKVKSIFGNYNINIALRAWIFGHLLQDVAPWSVRVRKLLSVPASILETMI